MFRMSSLLVSSALLLLLVSCGKDSGSGAGVSNSGVGSGGSSSFKVIGVSNYSGNGKFGESPLEALTNADGICATQFGGGFKALLGSALRRLGKDWVLLPDTEYRRSDNTTVIGVTNSSGTFDFPFDNSIASTLSPVWTGLSNIWGSAAHNCDGWTRDSGLTAAGGVSTMDNDNSINTGTNNSCASSSNLYCVEQ